jgi:hypothetical protein
VEAVQCLRDVREDVPGVASRQKRQTARDCSAKRKFELQEAATVFFPKFKGANDRGKPPDPLENFPFVP